MEVKRIAHRDQKRIALLFKYNDNLIAQVKQIEGRKYSKTLRCWHLPDNKASIRALKKNGWLATKVDYKITDPILQKIDSYKKYLEQQRYATSSIQAYVNIITIFFVWWKDRKPMEEMLISDLGAFNHAYFIEKQRSRSYQNIWVTAIRLFLEKETQISINPKDLERPRKSTHLPEVLSEEEVRRLIESYKNLKHKTIIMMYYACGLRKSELLNLTLQDLDSQRRVIRIRNSKGAKDRDLALPQSLLKLIATYYRQYKPKKYVFEGRNDKRYSAKSVDLILKKGLRKSGIKKKITTHILRHSYATHLVERNINLRFIQDSLGHNSSKTTEIYTKLSKEKIAQMVSPVDFWDDIKGT